MLSPAVIARFRGIKTPFYYYDTDQLKDTLAAILSAAGEYGYHLHYAVKANSNSRILEIISAELKGADCVSGYEIQRAVECGFDPRKILFAGVGKTDDEMRLGLQQDIFSFNCESLPELDVLDNVAADCGKKARVALRINPDVNARTHSYITTGLQENKFGINMWEINEVLDKIRALKNLDVNGLHFHIGSQITDFNVFKNLCNRINDLQRWFRDRHVDISHINVGGGLGVDYETPDDCLPDMRDFFSIFHRFLKLLPGQTLHFEPGRILVASCGDLITRVLFVKKGLNTHFAIVDAGMTELIRPALYQAYHKIENLSRADAGPNGFYDVVGPICESSDCFGKALPLPHTQRGDLLAIRTAGAYGEVMASNYNLRPHARVVYSDELCVR